MPTGIKRKGVFMKNLQKSFRILVMLTVFAITVTGCASSPSSSAVINPQLVGTWLSPDIENDAVFEITFRPNYTTASLVLYYEGLTEESISINVENGGRRLFFPNGAVMNGRLEGEKYIVTIADETMVFSRVW